ncbi:MAG: hypothetical protein CL840_21785 [Crocinitomicaceae bacterium]|nr:hypothetical protein [Crocinitomicaceae bacterium]|tara:strand:- start:16037 stop:17980 length:1944 start_codon:yes stop_codon:yes gene_type:complete
MNNNFLLFVVFTAAFQFLSFTGYALNDTTFWRSKARFIEVDEKAIEYGDVTIIQDNRYIAFNSFYREITRHKIIHIKTQEGLDANNKVVIHVPNRGEVLHVKARSISAEGEVVKISQDDIKVMKDYKQGGDVKMFAIEGAEVGGQIEFTYTLHTPLYDSGKELLSMNYRTLNACVLIRCVSQYKFDSRSFNWASEKIKTKEEHKYLYKNIAPIAEEKYSTPRANRVSVEFKILGNSTNMAPYSSYPLAIKSLQKDFHQFGTKEVRKTVGLLKDFNGKIEGNEEQTLRNLTVFLKEKLVYKEDYSPEYRDVMAIVKSGVGNDRGLMKVYCICLDHLNIDYELQVTCNKYDNRLREDYCSRHSLNEFILYFPKHDSYLYASGQLVQFGLAPSWIVGSTALVIPKNGSEVEFKEVLDKHPDSNRTDLKIDVNLDLAGSNTVLDIDGFGTGHLARNYNRIVYYSETEAETNGKLRDLVDWRYPDAQIVSMEMVDPEKWGKISECKDYSCKRAYKAKVKSTTFYEKVGNKLLLKVGTLLGPQVEMYSELKRVQPITTAYNKSYRFEITIPIPEGYKYSGAESLDIDNELVDDDDNIIAGFKSTVELKGRSLKINVYEFYSKVNIDNVYYDQYRIVINSAADFNKGMVLLEKE